MRFFKEVLASLFSRQLYHAYYPPASRRMLAQPAKSSRRPPRGEPATRGGVPVPRGDWEVQYARGDWAYMSGLEEQNRYSVIVGYLQQLKASRAILDVGCGEGLLFKRIKPYGYCRYVGIDIAEAAIAKLSQEQTSTAVFLRAEAETYLPQGLFDAIVFNEVLYYLTDPLGVVQQYAGRLNRGGILLIETYASSLRALAILRQLKACYRVVDEVRLERRHRLWIVSVLTN
ncbi:MAG: class I SAM-dependent methyltransferase [Bryobacteraceae bacterium]|jgi:2-polyprenyl-6-hydroxyphenyl methylase/3-demethylubiquinone-9 3-methyltransferase